MGLVDATGLTRKITRPRLLQFLQKHASNDKTLDIGCGNAQYGEWFPNRVTLEYEARDGVAVDIVGDAHDLHMIKDSTFDIVLCTEVLEHLHTPQKAISEFYRVLKPGGRLLLTTRFIYPLHDTPGDYFRYTKYGLPYLLRNFKIIDFQEEANTMETLSVLYQRIGFQCDTLWLRPFKIFWFLKAAFWRRLGWILTKEYGDIGHKNEESNILCSGYYVAAVKSVT